MSDCEDALAFRLSRAELYHAVGPIITASYQPPFSNLLTHSRKHCFVSNLAELKEGLWVLHSSEEHDPLQKKTDKKQITVPH